MWNKNLRRMIRGDERGGKMYFWDYKMEILDNLSGIM